MSTLDFKDQQNGEQVQDINDFFEAFDKSQDSQKDLSQEKEIKTEKGYSHRTKCQLNSTIDKKIEKKLQQAQAYTKQRFWHQKSKKMEAKFQKDCSSDCLYKNHRHLNEAFKPESLEMEKFSSIIIVINHDYLIIIQNDNYFSHDFCDICLSGNWEDLDQIVYCEVCNVAVHQSCYGGSLVALNDPNSKKQDPITANKTHLKNLDNWICERCIALLNYRIDVGKIKCFFCSERKGAIKNIKGNVWGHVSCVNWIPEIEFIESERDGKLRSKKVGPNCLLKQQIDTFII